MTKLIKPTDFIRKLQDNEKLTKINLRNYNINSNDLKLLSGALKNNKTVTHINLHNTNIYDDGAKIVAKFLQNNTTVTKIDLGYVVTRL